MVRTQKNLKAKIYNKLTIVEHMLKSIRKDLETKQTKKITLV